MAILTDAIRAALSGSRTRAIREAMAGDDLSIAWGYRQGDFEPDITQALYNAFREAQKHDFQIRIRPYMVSLVELYLSELATAYESGVRYVLLNEDGTEDEELTKQFAEVLADDGWDLFMSEVEVALELFQSAGVFYQWDEDGVQDCILRLPDQVFPVAPVEGPFHAANQKSYLGFVFAADEVGGRDTGEDASWVLSTPEGQLTYTSDDPLEIPTGQGVEIQNQLRAPGSGALLNRFSVWHSAWPTNRLLQTHEPMIVHATRELCIAFSALMDVFRYQAGAAVVVTGFDPESGRASPKVPTGARSPFVVQEGSSASYISPDNKFQEKVAFLRDVARFTGQLMSLSPGDFSSEARQVQSGFAKQVENLPKLKRSRKKKKLLRIQETRNAGRLLGGYVAAGRMPATALQRRLAAEFDDEGTVRSIDEEIAKDKHEWDHGLSTPAMKLAAREGISVEDAQARIDENLQAQRAGGLNAGRMADAIGRREEDESEEESEENEEDEDERRER